MPNRIIKESICSSDKIANLTDFEFRLWIGLITQVDDAGRGDARPAVIKGHVFPLRERVTVKDVDVALHGLADKGCVSLYDVDGKPYFYFPTWTEHQRIRDCKPKYPEPNIDNLRQVAASCGELRQTAAIIQSNTNPNPNIEDDEDDDADTAYVREAIIAAYQSYLGRKPNPTEISSLSWMASALNKTEVIGYAIERAATYGAKNIVQYVRTILKEWEYNCVDTVADVEWYYALLDREKNGLVDPEDAIRQREDHRRERA